MSTLRQVLTHAVPFDAFTRDIALICLSNLIGAFGEGLYFWVFPLYIRTLQADYVQLGFVFSALYGVSAVAPLLGGILADRYDRKKVLIIGWAPWVFSALIYSFAENWVQLIPGAACWGFSMIGVPAMSAYVLTATKDKKKLASVLSFVFSAYSVSYIVAPATGAYLATVIGMRWVLRLSSLLAGVSTIVFFLLRSQHPLKNEVEMQQRSVSVTEEKGLWRKMLLWSSFFAIVSFFMGIARPYMTTFLNEEIKLNEFYVGLFGSVNFAGITLMGIVLGRLGDRWRKSVAISLCLFLYIAAIAPLIFVRETSRLMFLAFLYGGSGVSGALVSSYVGSISPENKRGRWVSFPLSFSLLAAFAAPFLGGYLYTISPYIAFMVSFGAMPILIPFALTKLKE